jgi:hypothetical protein
MTYLSPMHQFEDNVEVLLILECFDEPDNVGVVESLVDSQFIPQQLDIAVRQSLPTPTKVIWNVLFTF